MKRADLVRHLEAHNCAFFREGAKHTIYKNIVTGAMSAIPRHREIRSVWRVKFVKTWASRVPELLLDG